MSVNWSTDYQAWLDSAKVHTNTNTALNTDKSNYFGNQTTQGIVQQFDKFCKNHTPEEAYLFFLSIVLSSTDPNNHTNILGIYQDELAGYGASIKVAANTTNLTNDLQNTFNSSSMSNQDVVDAYGHVTDMLSQFNDKNSDVYKSFDPQQVPGIVQQLTAIQSNFVTYFSFTYTPPGGGSTVTGKGSLRSFGQMNQEMGQKGDPDHAIEAAQGFTNASQALSADFGNVNAALNQYVSLTTGMINAWQSFGTAIMKDFTTESSASIQNEMPG